MTLAQILPTFNAGNTRCMSIKSVQLSFDLTVHNRRPIRMILFTHAIRQLAYDVSNWTLENWQYMTLPKVSGFQLYQVYCRVWMQNKLWGYVSHLLKQTGGSSLIVWNMFTWHRMDQLVCLNMSLTGKWYVALLCDNLFLFIDSMSTDPMMAYSKRIIHHVSGQNYFEQHSRDFWQIMSPYSPHETRRCLFACKILHL